MKTRLVTSAAALFVLALALIFFDTFFFPFAIAFVSAVAVYELLVSTSYIKDKIIISASVALGFIIPASVDTAVWAHRFLIYITYGSVLSTILLLRYEDIDFRNIAAALMISVLVPSMFAILVNLRTNYAYTGMFYVMLIFGGGWFPDAGAYFIGTFWGRHKLSPKISPQKTVEGFFGGFATAVAGYLLMGWIFSIVMPMVYPIIFFRPNYVYLFLLAPVLASAAVSGDLLASVLKRQTGIKDYGKIMPGHGGIMDRFDSVLFVAPVFYIALQYLPFNLVTLG
ncbi:MAG: phosphatidate cytidylyltransferase [Oscillospiraceae bacterium]|jgi:phosphatidate cytidylyltransferase|nr:phosphatidate cytidylyltransferase [Oscillospiraceae bacterium]